MQASPDTLFLTRTNACCTIHLAASLRSENCAPTVRNVVRVPIQIQRSASPKSSGKGYARPFDTLGQPILANLTAALRRRIEAKILVSRLG
jgi:hypothetical protein